MAKEIPYFKFFPGEWVTGDITLYDIASQGLFINICAYYWMKGCSMSLANAKQRFSKYEASLNQLLEFKIIKVDEEDNIIIDFMDEQLNEFMQISGKRAQAGKKGGKANAKQMLKFAKAKSSKEDKIREDKIREDKEKIIYPFESPKFLNVWKIWKEYKKKEHNFRYKSMISEQATLNKLNKLAGSNENIAIQIIYQSMEDGWKGLFELKKNGHGKQSRNYEATTWDELAGIIQKNFS